MKIIKRIILIVLAFSLLFLVACEEGKTTDGSGTTETKETTTKTETSEGTSFTDILGKRTTEYKAKYNIKTTAEGKTTSYTMMWAIKGKDKVKWSMEIPEQQASTVFYKIGTDLYMCSTTEGKEMCFKTQQDTPNFDSNLESYKDNSKYTTSTKAPRIIAGATALCFEVKGLGGDAQTYEVESCVSKEGVPLYMYSKGANFESTMEATEYSSSVADSEFTVPAGAQDLSALAQQYQQ